MPSLKSHSRAYWITCAVLLVILVGITGLAVREWWLFGRGSNPSDGPGAAASLDVLAFDPASAGHADDPLKRLGRGAQGLLEGLPGAMPLDIEPAGLPVPVGAETIGRYQRQAGPVTEQTAVHRVPAASAEATAAFYEEAIRAAGFVVERRGGEQAERDVVFRLVARPQTTTDRALISVTAVPAANTGHLHIVLRFRYAIAGASSVSPTGRP